MSVVEVCQSGRPDRLEEIMSVLKLTGVAFWFTISREELLDATWVYRIYSFDQKHFRLIDSLLHERIRQLMQDAQMCINMGDDLAGRSKIDALMRIWKEQWLSGTAHGEGNKFNIIK